MLVIEPKAHTTQSLAAAEPVVSTYFPAVHSVHATILKAAEYLPTAQLVQVAACMPEYVPASQSSQATVEVAEYWPA